MKTCVVLNDAELQIMQMGLHIMQQFAVEREYKFLVESLMHKLNEQDQIQNPIIELKNYRA